MKNFQDSIDKQFEFNQGKNLFSKGILASLRFSPDTLRTIENIKEIDKASESVLIDYLTDRAIHAFCKMNQYYTFDSQARVSLRNIYTHLFARLKKKDSSVEAIAQTHYRHLIEWITTTNPFAEGIYEACGATVEPVSCAEYSADLQMKILRIDTAQILQPVLDMGCGEQGNLVLFLRQKGIEAYGFDRFAFDHSYLSQSDWFEYSFGKDKWGTITSNLGFSNHFHHHHIRDNGNYIAYARKYMDILHALKVGGSFHYAPDLPFVEQYLDKDAYQLTKHRIGDYEFQCSIIKRMKEEI
ncbi:MAG TPA: hypothetical protein VHO72_11130 [Bacteroidales bacterium]|nr:hypothetical protein [Bacteroidales bacterium]